MTYQEKKEVERVCGKNFDEIEIPAYIRQRDNKEAGKAIELVVQSQRVVFDELNKSVFDKLDNVFENEL